MKKLLLLVFVLVCLVAVVTSVSAREVATVERIGDPTVHYTQDGLRQDCMVGNLNPPVSTLSGWFWGGEQYKYLFNPFEQCYCNEGFKLEMVHMYGYFDETWVYPIIFDVWVDLEDAMWFEDCWWPGVEDCVSDVVTVTITEAGLWDIAVPIDCECAYMLDPLGMPYWYLLSMHFVDVFDMYLVVDEFPTPCTAYNDWGSGWVDLYDQGFDAFGNIVMWGDVTCCLDPIANEDSTWGDVKDLFK
jgi:hypothetical protein